jgi:hypothetical protein
MNNNAIDESNVDVWRMVTNLEIKHSITDVCHIDFDWYYRISINKYQISDIKYHETDE